MKTVEVLKCDACSWCHLLEPRVWAGTAIDDQHQLLSMQHCLGTTTRFCRRLMMLLAAVDSTTVHHRRLQAKCALHGHLAFLSMRGTNYSWLIAA